MKSLLFYLLSFSPLIFLAQQEGIEVRGSTIEINLFLNGLDTSKYKGVDGSPYLNPEFIPARINEIEKTQFVRFNVVDNIVEVRTKEEKIVMLNLDNECTIQLLDGSNRIYRTVTYSIEGEQAKSFFELIKDGQNYSLYRQERKKFMKEGKAEAFKEKLPPRFIDVAPTFYFTDFNSDSSALIKLPIKKKKFVAQFATMGKSLEKYMKEEKLSLREKDDLIQIMDFIHSANK